MRVKDPDTKLTVEVEIRKLSTGEMVGLDQAYLENMGDEDEPNNPYAPGKFIVPLEESEIA